MISAVRNRRGGFTLLEITLVLAILVAAAAIAAPMFQSTMKRERLRKGAQLIAADWTRTRATAMEDGETQVWLCEVGGSSFSKSSYSTSGMTTADAASAVAATTSVTLTSTGSDSESFGQDLPYEVSVSEILVSEADSVVNMANTTTESAGGQATVFFYPDGTCSSARLTVADDEASISIIMNGMSGTVRVTRAQQVQQ